MTGHFHRALALINQNRWELAEKELLAELAANPDEGHPRSVYALCLSHRGAHDEATDQARQAVSRSPDWDYAHYVMARVLLAQDRLTEADKAINEAIRLDPEDADYPALLAAIELQRGRGEAALAAADRALALDAEHDQAANLRAMALVKLGRRAEADRSLEGALSRDPENALTHANKGWSLLHGNDPPKALEHFREALRLDPENDYARSGLVEALKARYFIYRWLLRYFLWMGRLSSAAQWAVIIGMLVGMRVLRAIGREFPAFEPFVTPIAIAYMAFVMLTWIAHPMFNLLLRFSKFGRYALSKVQKTSAHCLAALMVTVSVAGIGYLLTKEPVCVGIAIYFAAAIIPTSMTTSTEHDGQRRRLWIWTALLLAFGASALPVWFINPVMSRSIVGLYVLGCMLFSWVASAVRSERTYT